MGLPQGVDAGLVGPLAVVVPGGVQRHVGVRQIMAQIGGRAQHVLQVGRGGIRGRHQAYKLAVCPMQLPWQHSEPAGIQGAVARGQQGFVIWPPHSNQPVRASALGQRLKHVVEVEVMSWRLKAVDVFAGVGRGGVTNQQGGIPAPCVLEIWRQLHPCLGMDVSVGGEPPSHQQGRKDADDRACQDFMWTSVHGSDEPKNRFSRWGWPCSCWRQAILHVLV